MSKRYFGTDGIRGRVGTPPITPEFLLRLGWAAGMVFKKPGRDCLILIGKDTRLSGYMIESILEAGLASAGVHTKLLGPMPTPAIAYLTRTFRADAGVVISASHNPYEDNGIKFFGPGGHKLPDEIEEAIEQRVDEPMTVVGSPDLGRASRMEDAEGRYIEFCKASVERGVNLRGLKVVVDCANGATYQVAPAVFSELGAKVTSIAVSPDGLNINRECGSTHPEALQQKVKEIGADLGIALDGDGDRVLMVDKAGELVDGDELLFIIARHRQTVGDFKGGVVGTLMTNFGLEHALNEHGIPLRRANVGDRFVLEEMQKQNWILGGESSGHIVCLDRTTTGDGVISALQVLSAMQASGRGLHELRNGMRKFPQKMVNVRTHQPARVRDNSEVLQHVRRVEQSLAGKGRVLLRPSGTEPVVRVMVEGECPETVGQLAEELANTVRRALA